LKSQVVFNTSVFGILTLNNQIKALRSVPEMFLVFFAFVASSHLTEGKGFELPPRMSSY